MTKRVCDGYSHESPEIGTIMVYKFDWPYPKLRSRDSLVSERHYFL